jgi:FkbM family methyltransferase
VHFLSYAQRFEDVYLSRCFPFSRQGFYIDIGSGHPVHDNASFAFYLEGWRGITVEPNPRLSRLARAVRPHDCHIEALVGAASGEGTFYVVDEWHGLSTMIEAHAKSAGAQFGKKSRSLCVPMLTLAELCQRYAPRTFEFLKIDVEGAEKDVLFSGDWENFRPKIIVIEALAPYSLAPAWPEWEAFLERYGYRYACFDSLNRYYVAHEAHELVRCFDQAESAISTVVQFRTIMPALSEETHPDHPLAARLARAFMTDLPLLDSDLLFEMLTMEIARDLLDAPAGQQEIASAVERVFGPAAAATATERLHLPNAPNLGDIYHAIVASDEFRAAAGRISASYAW